MNASTSDKIKNLVFPLTCLAVMLYMILCPCVIAFADAPPGVPQQFYGAVTINGVTAAAGYIVVTKVNGVDNAWSTTDSQGRYGYSSALQVTGTQGATIDFYVNNVKASQTASFTAGNISELNLTVSGTVPPPGSVAPPGTATTITTSILSQADSLVLNNSTLVTAKTLASSDSRVKLSFMANTTMNLQGQTTLGAANESSPPSASDGSTMVNAYAFSPSSATFSPAATLTLTYDTLPSGVTESGLYIAYYDGANWQKLTSTVNTSTKAVTASVSHFTIFAIRYAAPSETTTTTTTTTETTETTQTTPTTGTVSTNVLGTSGSFSVSNGVVASPASIASTNGNLSLSLASNTAVNLQGSQNMTVIQLASSPTPPSGSKAIAAYSFGPDNATFSPAATLTVKYDPASLPTDVSESNLYIALLQNSSWSELNSTVNTSAKTVTAQISHFSTYAVLGKTYTANGIPVTTAGAGAFSTSDLAVSPASAKAGEMVTVSVRVVNGGAGAATGTVVLKINDQDEAQKNVTMSAGESKVVSFNVSRSDPGIYKVSIDSQSDSFQVTGGSGGQPADMSTLIIIIIAAGGLLVIFLVIMLIMRQRSS